MFSLSWSESQFFLKKLPISWCWIYDCELNVFVCVFKIKACFYLFVSVPEYYNLQHPKCLLCYRSVCVNQLYIVENFGWGKLGYYKPMRRASKKGGIGNFRGKIEGGGQKGVHNFWLKFGGWKNLEGNYGLFLEKFTPNIQIQVTSK